MERTDPKHCLRKYNFNCIPYTVISVRYYTQYVSSLNNMSRNHVHNLSFWLFPILNACTRILLFTSYVHAIKSVPPQWPFKYVSLTTMTSLQNFLPVIDAPKALKQDLNQSKWFVSILVIILMFIYCSK